MMMIHVTVRQERITTMQYIQTVQLTRTETEHIHNVLENANEGRVRIAKADREIAGPAVTLYVIYIMFLYSQAEQQQLRVDKAGVEGTMPHQLYLSCTTRGRHALFLSFLKPTSRYYLSSFSENG